MGVLTSRRNAERPKALFEFTQGIDVDARLMAHEVRVQKAWSRGLVGVGLLTEGEFQDAARALDEAQALEEKGSFPWRMEDEDIHMNLERFVTEKAGAIGKKMHAGRSRNDLIATTLRLFAASEAEQVLRGLGELTLALVERAEQDIDVLVPGLTHVQHGQPIRHAHALAAHAWGFVRDAERVSAARARALEAMPLGAAALSGTPLAIDLEEIARELGFRSPPLNSYDAVGDRDFALELIAALASVAVHLSRLAEDCVLWSSTAVGLGKLPPAWSTGSSIMPNKRNPDVPELVRGKSAHMMGASANALALLKGVPTSYGSDLHELKQVLLRALDETSACLAVLPEFIRGFEPDRERAKELLRKGHILATEIADELARQGLPFREAYAQVAALVERAEENRVQVHELPSSLWKAIAPRLEPAFFEGLDFTAAVERRSNCGGTSLETCRAGLSELRARVSGQMPELWTPTRTTDIELTP